jgi:tetratricopeptide (TPR) repeat protein
LLFSGDPPELVLEDREQAQAPIAIHDVSRQGEAFTFRQPLADVAPGNYDLIVRIKGAEVYRRTLFVLSFEFEKPLVFERTVPLSYLSQLPFVVGQEYLNAGRLEKAIESFEKLPPNLWNASTLPVIARAHYLHKDYSRVVELLEGDKVEKSFPVLLLLGNASLELKKLDRAAVYFEEVRKFGDTAEVNNTLGAVYFSLGAKEKAKVYWGRAKKLEQAAGKNRDPVEKKSTT